VLLEWRELPAWLEHFARRASGASALLIAIAGIRLVTTWLAHPPGHSGSERGSKAAERQVRRRR
jgi:hypothetical protein